MAAEPVGLASLGPSVYLPSLLYGIGQGAVAPVIALSARELGASVPAAAMVVAAVGIGRVLGDVPAGRLAAWAGERAAMFVSIGISLVALAVCIAAPSVAVLATGVAITGAASAAFALARHAYVSEVIPFALRARALATLAGTLRIGLFAGPFLGALVISRLGTDGAYWLAIVMSVSAGLALVMAPEPPGARAAHRRGTVAPGSNPSLKTIINQHARVLATLGVTVLLLGAVRASRQAVIPLWAEHVGLEPATISLIFGASGAVEAALFYPGGLAMDRLGRRWVIVPATLILAVSLALVPLTSRIETLGIVAIMMGVGNGLGSGTNMVIGADVAPAAGRAAFLGVWRLFSDFGAGAGPILISVVAAGATISVAIVAIGVAGVAAALLMARWLPRH